MHWLQFSVCFYFISWSRFLPVRRVNLLFLFLNVCMMRTELSTELWVLAVMVVLSTQFLSLRWLWGSVPAGGVTERPLPVTRLPLLRYQQAGIDLRGAPLRGSWWHSAKLKTETFILWIYKKNWNLKWTMVVFTLFSQKPSAWNHLDLLGFHWMRAVSIHSIKCVSFLFYLLANPFQFPDKPAASSSELKCALGCLWCCLSLGRFRVLVVQEGVCWREVSRCFAVKALTSSILCIYPYQSHFLCLTVECDCSHCFFYLFKH